MTDYNSKRPYLFMLEVSECLKEIYNRSNLTSSIRKIEFVKNGLYIDYMDGFPEHPSLVYHAINDSPELFVSYLNRSGEILEKWHINKKKLTTLPMTCDHSSSSSVEIYRIFLEADYQLHQKYTYN